MSDNEVLPKEYEYFTPRSYDMNGLDYGKFGDSPVTSKFWHRKALKAHILSLMLENPESERLQLIRGVALQSSFIQAFETLKYCQSQKFYLPSEKTLVLAPPLLSCRAMSTSAFGNHSVPSWLARISIPYKNSHNN